MNVLFQNTFTTTLLDTHIFHLAYELIAHLTDCYRIKMAQ